MTAHELDICAFRIYFLILIFYFMSLNYVKMGSKDGDIER